MQRNDTQDLIERLSGDAPPLRRQRPPLVRAVLWLAAAFIILAGLVAIEGVRHDLDQSLGRADALLGWAASILTGIVAAVAAFHLAVPGHPGRWALAPLPLAAVWLATLGAGCYLDWLQSGPDGLVLGTSFTCLGFVVVASALLGAPLMLLLRHAILVRPALTAATAGLAVAALASAALELFHHLDTRLMVLIWHVGSVLLVIGLSTWAARAVARDSRARLGG